MGLALLVVYVWSVTVSDLFTNDHKRSWKELLSNLKVNHPRLDLMWFPGPCSYICFSWYLRPLWSSFVSDTSLYPYFWPYQSIWWLLVWVCTANELLLSPLLTLAWCSFILFLIVTIEDSKVSMSQRSQLCYKSYIVSLKPLIYGRHRKDVWYMYI